MIERFHVFTDNRDFWFAEYRIARKLYDNWKRRFDAVRLYVEQYEDQEAYENDELLFEDCLLSHGDYPM